MLTQWYIIIPFALRCYKGLISQWKCMLPLFWGFLSKRVIVALTSSYVVSATVNCGIVSVPSSVWNRLLIGIVVCPLFTLNKIQIIINHGVPRGRPSSHARRSIIFCDNATRTHLVNVLRRSGLKLSYATIVVCNGTMLFHAE